MNTATTTCFDVTEIHEEIDKSHIFLYPNPAKDMVTITYESGKSQNIVISIINGICHNLHTNI